MKQLNVLTLISWKISKFNCE